MKCCKPINLPCLQIGNMHIDLYELIRSDKLLLTTNLFKSVLVIIVTYDHESMSLFLSTSGAVNQWYQAEIVFI